ncbi:MAG: bamA 2 [Acidobacteria bacterium]|nr:bamA 2 [Acidobacteriota bacterium]
MAGSRLSPMLPGEVSMPIRVLLSLLLALLFALSPGAGPMRGQNASVRVASIAFEGNQSIGAQQLKRLFRTSLEGREYNVENLRADLRQVEKIYQDSGFLDVQVGPPDVQFTGTGEKRAADIRVRVTEGPQYRAGDVSVRDAGALGAESFAQMCPLEKGQPYSRHKINQWLAKAEDAHHSMGYLRARCETKETLNVAARTVDCTLSCAEGKVFSVGKITLRGDETVKPAEFKRRLLFSEGGVFNPEMLSLSIQYLNQMRVYKPITGPDVDIRIDDEKGTVDLTLRVASLDP